MKIPNFYFGMGLQALSAALAWVFIRFGYSIGWLPTLAISVPLMGAGIYYVFRSDVPLPVRILCGGWIFGLAAWRVVAYSIDSSRVQAEVYLIPEGYRGEVQVFFGKADGEAVVEENGKILLKIGAQGALSTRLAVAHHGNDLDSKRTSLQEYYFAMKDGTRKRIDCPEKLDLDKMGENDVSVFTSGSDLGPGGSIARSNFFVGTKSGYREWINPKR